MKRRVAQLIWTVLLLPLVPLIGVPAADPPKKKEKEGDPADDPAADPAPDAGATEGDPSHAAGDPDPQPKDPPKEDPQPDKPAEEDPAAPAKPEPAAEPQPDTEREQLQRDLMMANAQLTAIKSGVSAECAEDAVVLAMHDVAKSGADPDDAALSAAVTAVIKRHPEFSGIKSAPAKAGVGDPAGGDPGNKRPAPPRGRVVL